MNNTLRRSTILSVLIFAFSFQIYAGNTPCGATPIPNNMTSFLTYNNQGNTDSGIEAPNCGNYVTADFWFSTTVPPSGILNIVTLAGGMTNGAMAIYTGDCSNLDFLACTEDDNCGNTVMPIMNLTDLQVGAPVFIRIWAEFGAPNGTFEIRVSDGPIGPIPLPTTATVGTAEYTMEDCVQLTTTSPGQTGCAWDPVQIDMNNPFDETFLFNFGDMNSGADGICWVFQNNPAGLNTCGSSGQNIASNFNNSFIIEFDTYDNGPGFSDIPNDHVSVNVNGMMGNAINGPFDLGNIEDGQDHEIRFVWDPSSNSYEIYFDGMLTLSGSYDIINNCLGGNPLCYWGFTGSTGGAVNNQSVCPADVPEYPAGSLTNVDVDICEGESYYAGGANQTTTGFYTDINPLPNGCDEVINTNLTVHPASNFEYDMAHCQGDCETVGNQTFCSGGTFEVTLFNQAWNGCDSIVTLNLTILDPIAVAFPPAPLTCFSPTTLIDASASTNSPGIVSYSWTGPTPGCILSGENTSTPVVECPGTYTMTLVQELNGTVCATMLSVDVIDGAIEPTAEAGNNQNIDCNATCVFLSSAGSDSGPNITLTWSGPNSFISNDPYPEVCEPGVYTLTILNQATGCLSSDVVIVTGNANPPDIDATVSGNLTCENTMVILDGSNSSGMGNLDFEWLDGNSMPVGTSPQIAVSESGLYTLIITDDVNGCTAEMNILVAENTIEPIAVINSPDSLDCSGNPVSLDGSNSTANGTLNYEWQDEDDNIIGTNATTTVQNPGDYTLIITDAQNGCTATAIITVEQDIQSPNPLAEVNGILTCQNTQVQLDATNSTGIGNLDFEWLDANGNSIANSPTTMVSDTLTYTLIITDNANGCTAQTTINATEDIQSPDPDIIADGPLTCLDTMVVLDGSASSGIGTIEFQWLDSNGNILGTNPTIEISDTSSYTLIITDDANGCTATTTFNASENLDTPNPLATVDDVLTCTQTEVTLDGNNSSGTGNLDFEWFDENGMSVSSMPTAVVSDTNFYTLIITDDANGCTAEISINADQNINPPIADAGPGTFITCQDSTVSLDGSGSSSGAAFTYEWIGPSGGVIGSEIMIDVTQSGIYTLIVLNEENGCTASDSTEVIPDASLPLADAGTGGVLTCSTTAINLDGSASSSGSEISYEWFDPGDNSLGTDVIIEATTAGTFTLVVTNEDNGCSAASTVLVEEDISIPDFDLEAIPTLTCSETEVAVTAINTSGENLFYQWNNANGENIGTGITTNVTQTGTYTLIVTNLDNDCIDSLDFETMADTLAPVADAGGEGLLTCTTTAINLDGSASSSGSEISYEWFDPLSNPLGTDVIIEATTAGTYTLIVTNENNGCTDSAQTTVSEDTLAPQADAGLDLVLDCGTTSVLLDGSNSSGGTLEYEWYDEDGILLENAVSTAITDTGDYVLIITNLDNGCTAEDEVTVSGEYEPPLADPGIVGLLTCSQSEIILDGSASTGSGTLQYEWLEGNIPLGNADTLEVTTPGEFTLIVTDLFNACTASAVITVDEDTTPPTADAGPEATLTCDITNVILDGNNSTGVNLSFEWQNEDGELIDNTPSILVDETGEYTLIVTDANNGCTASSSTTVVPDDNLPLADAGLNANLTCVDTTAQLDGSNSDSGPNFTYAWQNPGDSLISSSPTAMTTLPGLYTLIVTDTDNGCSASSTVEVFENINPPTADAGPEATLTCDITDVILDGNNSTGSNLSFEWQNEDEETIDNTPTILVDETGEYTLIVTDANNGCTASSSTTVVPDDNLPYADAGSSENLTCSLNTVQLDGSNSDSGPNFSYVWQNPADSVISTNTTAMTSIPGIYTLIVTDEANGCSAISTIEIEQDTMAPIPDAGSDQFMICGQTEVTLNASGGQNLLFEWQDDAGNFLGDQAEVEVYNTGTFTLNLTNTENGCTASTTVQVISDMESPTVEAGTAPNLTCDILSVSLSGEGSSVGSNFTYEWQDEVGTIIGTDLSVLVDLPGTYTLIVTNNDNNCQAQDQVAVIQNITDPTAFADYGSATSLDCNNSFLILDGSGSAPFGELTFQWNTNDGNIVTGDTTINPEINEPGTYSLIVTNQNNGCTDSTLITVDENTDLPEVLIETPELLTCATTQLMLDATQSSSQGDYSYTWTGSGIESGETTLNPIINEAGNYTLTIVDNENGCENEESITVLEDVTTPDAVAATNEQFDCITESISLSGDGSSLGSEFSYQWTGNGNIDNANSLNPTVYEPGVFTLIVTDANNGCTESSSVNAPEDTNVPSSIGTIVEDPLCYGDPGSISVFEIIGGTPPYLISIDGGANFGAQTLFTNLEPGDYELLIQDAIGCEYQEMISIYGVNELIVDVIPEVLLQFGDSYEINALVSPSDQIDTIIWSPTQGLSCTDCLNPTVDTILNMAVYTITVINENGCVATDQIHLRVQKDKDVYIPNAFTPGNQDGHNDYLTVFGNSRRINQINSFQVYNRWGEMVFQHTNFQPNIPTEGWNGTFQGELVNPAVFIYWAEVEFVDGTKEIFKGDVTLIR